MPSSGFLDVIVKRLALRVPAAIISAGHTPLRPGGDTGAAKDPLASAGSSLAVTRATIRTREKGRPSLVCLVLSSCAALWATRSETKRMAEAM
jgi:hypothetical protein